jgi:inorganic pyrophosphatase
MSLNQVSAGDKLPDELNALIEIPMQGEPVKYEINKATETVFVDRILFTSMRYPCNYGYIPQTLADDGDPLDILVLAPVPLLTASVIRCRPLGLFNMTDEHGNDTKIVAVPLDSVCNLYSHYRDIGDVPASQREQISHFFAHYKDLEPGKTVKTGSWEGIDRAREEIARACRQYKEAH